jgi:GTP cyclohydrolase II
LRRTLFEETGGSYPELITRHDIKLFLPPIGGLTVYIFGDPAKMSDPNSKLALRIHDECNGSDVFGSDICTCRPYLTFGIEEAVKEAQKGGSGVVIYFRKEGRALGEVTKYLVYNARKRGEDRASEYFKRTENIAGVKDMRFQALMPDILHWLGITKIDRMLSMSNMKHDAIVDQGIPIRERVPIPDDMIPADSRVEIDAKIQAGYCTYSPHPVTPYFCLVSLQSGDILQANFWWTRTYADFCSYNWPCHVHGRAGKRKGPWLGRH